MAAWPPGPRSRLRPRICSASSCSTTTSATFRCSRPTSTATSFRGPNGFPQIVTASGSSRAIRHATTSRASGRNGVARVPADMRIRTGHAFLADIAHNAVPDGIADGDIEIGLATRGNRADGDYDNELLDAHFIAGDGRANENIGLTAVHHVFHSEHNRLVEHTKEVVLATERRRLHQ